MGGEREKLGAQIRDEGQGQAGTVVAYKEAFFMAGFHFRPT
jgi:hypothetical protein